MTELMAGRALVELHLTPSHLPHTPYAVNVGCWDGRSFNDPCYPLYASGFGGLAIEWGDPPELHENLGAFPGVRILARTYVTEANVAGLLHDAGCPVEPEFLKMDIDGDDAAVLKAVLEGGFRPLVIQAEVNPEIPPPYSFTVRSSPELRPGFGYGFFGMSLQFAVDLLDAFDYALTELDFETEYTHDALFVRRDVLDLVGGLKEVDAGSAFRARPPLLPHLPGASAETKASWRDRDDHEAVLAEMREVLADASLRKHGHSRVTFFLGGPHQGGG